MQEPIISIIVVTFNSEKFILETLNSIKNQSYKNIELIISDDNSTDNTIPLCKEWIQNNYNRFPSVHLVTAIKNTGIPSNCNRGLKESTGDWIKVIAGDDILKSNAITDLYNYVKDSDKEIVTAQMQEFTIINDKKVYGNFLIGEKNLSFFKLNAQEQFKYYIKNNLAFTPGIFIKSSTYRKVGIYDEQYKYIEDLPFYLKCLKNGIKIYFLEKPLVLYRIHSDGVSQKRQNCLYKKDFKNCWILIEKKEIFPYIKWYDFIYWQNIFIDRIKYFVAINFFHNHSSNYSNITLKVIGWFSFKKILKSIKTKLVNILSA